MGTIQQDIISSLPKQEREVEVQRFYHYLGEILNHDKYKQYGSLARMLMYNGKLNRYTGIFFYARTKSKEYIRLIATVFFHKHMLII